MLDLSRRKPTSLRVRFVIGLWYTPETLTYSKTFQPNDAL